MRSDAGLASVLFDSRLSAAARAHSTDMVARGYFSHLSPDGSSSSDRARAAGVSGSDGALDLYYPNERCKSAKLRKLALKAKTRKKKTSRKQRRKLRRLNRRIGNTCRASAVEPPLL